MKKKWRNRDFSKSNFFDLPSALKKKIIERAVRESTKIQVEMLRKYDLLPNK